MALPLRRFIDIESNVDKSKLSPIQKVLISIRSTFQNSDIYSAIINRERKQTIEAIEKEKKEIISVINKTISDELSHNKTVSSRGEEGSITKSIDLVADRALVDRLREAMSMGELSSYELEEIRVNPDILTVHPNTPLLINISKVLIEYKEDEDDMIFQDGDEY